MKFQIAKLIGVVLIFISFNSNNNTVQAQNNVGIGTLTPDASALLHLESNDKGLLIPRMTTVLRNNIDTPANGLLIYNTSEQQLNYYDASSATWVSLSPNNGGGGNASPWLINASNEIYNLADATSVGTDSPNPSAAFQVDADEKGMLLPRLSNLGKANIVNPADGLIIYNISNGFMEYYDAYQEEWYRLARFDDITSSSIWIEENDDAVFSGGDVMIDGDAAYKIGGTNVLSNYNSNTALGSLAGTNSDTSVIGALYIGNAAGFQNEGSFNTFIGNSSGSSNGSGAENTFVGFASGSLNSSGTRNVMLGYQAGYSSLSSDNVIIGHNAAYNNEFGAFNTIIGSSAGMLNNNGSSNVFIGYESGMQNYDGFNNVFVGYQTGENNTSGRYNTMLGHQAGTGLSTGESNTYIGYQAGPHPTGGNSNQQNATAIGYQAIANCNDCLVLGSIGESTTNDDVSVGIGTAFPTAKLSIASNNSADDFLTTDASGWVQAGSAALGISRGNGVDLATYTYGMFFTNREISSQSDLSNYDDGGLYLNHTSNENVYLATGGGDVGIGTNEPSYQLELSINSAAKPGGGSWATASDRRLKTDITPYTDGLQQVLAIKPVWYRYTEASGLQNNQSFVGIIAQDMQKVAPYTVGTFTKRNGEAYLNFDPSALDYMLINAVQEQQTVIEDLQAENDALKAQIAKINNILGISE